MKRTRCGRFVTPEPRGRLPASGWRRVLALWGFTAVPFFKFEDVANPDVRCGTASPGYEESRG